ncbi:MAG: hypothetical protein U0518_06045 [Candidatus Gracilibacteria bacterium]
MIHHQGIFVLHKKDDHEVHNHSTTHHRTFESLFYITLLLQCQSASKQ